MLSRQERHHRAQITPAGKIVCASWGIESVEELQKRSNDFNNAIRDCIELASNGRTDEKGNELFYRLRKVFVEQDIEGLIHEMRYCFTRHLVQKKDNSVGYTETQKNLADLQYPMEWFPETRAMQRTIHLHVGPTNSGKTYQALKRLEAAESGIYAGPLRLLAHEVYTRLNARGKLCALMTGEERRVPPGMKHHMSSCTVEMVPLGTKVDVAVIDEIQMMGDTTRGWAWTQVLLGVQAKEVHLCGEVRTVELVTELCAAMGDKLEIHQYERLSPLAMMGKSLGGSHSLSNLQKGDAIILFSRIAIHAMKSKIESVTDKRCAVIYGSLPPETRAQQAALFNDPDNDYDYLAASDAVGMGLNLSIKRVIFETSQKYNGIVWSNLAISEIKQIAGRAGRYRTAQQAIEKVPIDLTDGKDSTMQSKDSVQGWVTTLQQSDYPVVAEAMAADAPPLKSAGILPPSHVIAQFASYFPPDTPFSYILMRLHDLAALNPRFHLCHITDRIEVADVIQPHNLTIEDRMTFSAAPVSLSDPGFSEIVSELAKCIADCSNGHLLDIKSIDLGLLGVDPIDFPGGATPYLRQLETVHKAITLYLWLSYRFSGVFLSQPLAFHVKELLEAKIDEALRTGDWKYRHRLQSRKEAKRMQQAKEELELVNLESVSSPAPDVAFPVTPEDQARDGSNHPLSLSSTKSQQNTISVSI